MLSQPCMSDLTFNIRPADCAFVICIPLSKEDFNKDKINIQKDFIRNSGVTWPKYESEIVQPLQKIIPDIEMLGTRVYKKICFSDYQNLFKEENKVIIILAHCLDSIRVEFSDGLYDIQSIAALTPTSYIGFLDFCICNPVKLAQLISAGNDNCRIRTVNAHVSISLWLYYYWIFIRLINETNTDYFNAVKKASLLFDQQILKP